MDKKRGESYISKKLREAAESGQISGDYAPTMSQVEIFGNYKIIIQNHKGIVEYGDTLMKINCGKNIIKIVGTELELKAMNSEAIAIVGKIITVEYIN